MTRVACLLALSACGTAHDAKPKPPAQRDAAIADPPMLVELLHAAPSTIRVSSQVKNKEIVPKHLVDSDFTTAWNSRTGELAGTWIDVAVAPGAMIHELRLTVGHTGMGPKAEDYFEMNPRIRTVSLIHAGGVVKMAALDTDKRTLQTIKLPAPAAEIRLRVDDVEMGSKASWREVCISELEAWGTVPPNVAGASAPQVDVGDSDEPVIEDIATYCAEHGKNHRYCLLENPKPIVEPPWLGVAVLGQEVADAQFDFRIAIQTPRGWWIDGNAVTCKPTGTNPMCSVIVTKSKVTAPDTLEITYMVVRSYPDDSGPDSLESRSITCRHDGLRVQCGDPRSVQ